MRWQAIPVLEVAMLAIFALLPLVVYVAYLHFTSNNTIFADKQGELHPRRDERAHHLLEVERVAAARSVARHAPRVADAGRPAASGRRRSGPAGRAGEQAPAA